MKPSFTIPPISYTSIYYLYNGRSRLSLLCRPIIRHILTCYSEVIFISRYSCQACTLPGSLHFSHTDYCLPHCLCNLKLLEILPHMLLFCNNQDKNYTIIYPQITNFLTTEGSSCKENSSEDGSTTFRCLSASSSQIC